MFSIDYIANKAIESRALPARDSNSALAFVIITTMSVDTASCFWKWAKA